MTALPRPRHPAPPQAGQPLRVSTLELFFDLVFVFRIRALPAGTGSRQARNAADTVRA
jgi:low temperature requirement protein LtrA